MGGNHLPVIVDIRTTAAPPSRIRKARWADWRVFQEDREAALTFAEPVRAVR